MCEQEESATKYSKLVLLSKYSHILRIREYGHSQYPFTMTLYRDPTQLAHPVRVVTGLNSPYGIAFNSCGKMIVSERMGHQIAIFDIRGKRIQTFGSYGHSPEQMKYPAGIAIDDMDNIYVTSKHKLQKFTGSGELIKCVGQWGSEEGEFNHPRGLTLHNNQVYVCDRCNHRIQVFDLDLNFIRFVGSHGKGRGEFDEPYDVKFDRDGYMYIADCHNKRVQVLDRSGHCIRVFGINHGPIAIHIVDKYVYVCEEIHILVYETSGHFFTSFAIGYEWSTRYARSISFCADGFMYVSCWASPPGVIKIF